MNSLNMGMWVVLMTSNPTQQPAEKLPVEIPGEKDPPASEPSPDYQSWKWEGKPGEWEAWEALAEGEESQSSLSSKAPPKAKSESETDQSLLYLIVGVAFLAFAILIT